MGRKDRHRAKYVVTVEARMTSTRLPGKMMMPVGGKPALEVMLERVQRAREPSKIVVATTVNEADTPLAELASRMGVGCFRGSEQDVLGRVLGAARAYQADYIVELTGDSPLIDPMLIDECVSVHRNSDADYVHNLPQDPIDSYPAGMCVQVFAAALLAEADQSTDDPDDREHVSLWIRDRPQMYRHRAVSAPPELRWSRQFITLDTKEDLRLIRAVYDALAPVKPDFGVRDIVGYLRDNPQVAKLNAGVPRAAIDVDFRRMQR